MPPRRRYRSVRRTFAVVLLAAATLALPTAPARAGAWPREPGGVFFSVRTDFERSRDGGDLSGSLYGEYDLSKRVTLVGQISNSDEPWTLSRASTAVNIALGRLDAANRFAVSLGVSSPPSLMGAMTGVRLETAVHWGCGFESRWGGGWATATARVLFARDEARPITDLSALVGLRPADRWMTMLSASRYADEDGVYWKVSPSYGYELRDELWIVPNLTQELSDDRSTSVGLSLWFSF